MSENEFLKNIIVLPLSSKCHDQYFPRVCLCGFRFVFLDAVIIIFRNRKLQYII